MSLSNRHIYSLFLIIVFLSGCSIPKIVILQDPLTAEEHLQLGLSYEKKGLLQEAIEHYKEASKRDARGFLFLGNIYLTTNDYDKAEENYKKALKKDSKLADAYNNLAWLYYLKGEKLDIAEELVNKAIQIEQDKPEKVKQYEDTLKKIRERLKTENP